MSPIHTHRQLPDAIPSKLAEDFKAQYSDLLDHEITRKKINAIVKEYVGSVEFMKKVREYSSMEIDSRMFRSGQYWLAVIITSVITTAIGVGITHLLSK